ncbi:glycosyltransferase family 2 protein [Candidatus Woesearchaeota archaeon]|nr:glycosyltransferase family 2 protein [Candidatus Woesearchaeota archaeon]
MIQYILWIISFVFLWLSLVWVNYLHVSEPGRRKARFVPVTIGIPAFNEENTIAKTLHSLRALAYTQGRIRVVVVDDGSTDKTAEICSRYIAEHRMQNVVLVRQKNQGKAAAINTALARAETEYFAVLDADTRVTPNALAELVSVMQSSRSAAAISVVKVDHPESVYERVQHVEYMLSNLFRRLMGVADTLFLTHGGFCLFNTSVLKGIQGFSEDNGHTEDLEVAMRLRAHGHRVIMVHNAITYTTVPNSFATLWRQRVRWYRGFLYNHVKFKNLLLNRKYGSFGLFQLPVNLLSVVLLLATIILVTYGTISDAAEFVYRSVVIDGYFVNHVLDFPSLKELVLAQNVQITLPIVMSTLVGLYVLVLAFRQFEERLRPSIFFIWLYFMVFPYLTSLHWIHALVQETFHMKRRWR